MTIQEARQLALEMFARSNGGYMPVDARSWRIVEDAVKFLMDGTVPTFPPEQKAAA